MFIPMLQLTEIVFPAVCAQRVQSLLHRCRCTPRAGGCGEVEGWTSIVFQHTDDLQAARWPHPLLCCSPTTALTFFCTQMRTLLPDVMWQTLYFTALLPVFEIKKSRLPIGTKWKILILLKQTGLSHRINNKVTNYFMSNYCSETGLLLKGVLCYM